MSSQRKPLYVIVPQSPFCNDHSRVFEVRILATKQLGVNEKGELERVLSCSQEFSINPKPTGMYSSLETMICTVKNGLYS